MMLQRQAFLLPFAICLVITCTVLWFWRTRNPVKKFRPPVGAVFLLGLILVMVSGAASYMVANTVLEGEEMVQHFKDSKKKEKYLGSGGGPGGDANARGGSWERMGAEVDTDPQQLEEQDAAAEAQKSSMWGKGGSK